MAAPRRGSRRQPGSGRESAKYPSFCRAHSLNFTALSGRRFRQGRDDGAIAFTKIGLRDPLEIGFGDLLVTAPDRIDQSRIVIKNCKVAQRIGARATAVSLLRTLAAPLHLYFGELPIRDRLLLRPRNLGIRQGLQRA